MDVAVALVVGLLVAGAGAALLLLAAWCRRGRSAASRWWVRRGGLEHASLYLTRETFALAWVPMLAQTLLLAGPAIPLVALLGSGTAAGSTTIGMLVVVELVLWMAVLFMTGYRWVLPLWMYPDWLREVRRGEVEQMRATPSGRL